MMFQGRISPRVPALLLAVVAVLVGAAVAGYFLTRSTGAGESPVAAPAPSPSPTASPTAVATLPVSPAPTPVYGPPTPYPPIAPHAPNRPSCAEGWAPYDIAAASYAFCAPEGWDVIVGSSDARMVGVRNPAFSARLAESWPKGGDILPGEVSVWLDNEPKNPTIEKRMESCREFELTISGDEAFGCVSYGSRVMGTPEDLITVTTWIDRDETILIASGRFWASKTTDTDKETILQLARSIQLR